MNRIAKAMLALTLVVLAFGWTLLGASLSVSAQSQTQSEQDYRAFEGGVPVAYGEMSGTSGTTYTGTYVNVPGVGSTNQSSRTGLEQAASDLFEGSIWVLMADGRFGFFFSDDYNPIAWQNQYQYIPGEWQLNAAGDVINIQARLSYSYLGMTADMLLEAELYVDYSGQTMARAVYQEQSVVGVSAGGSNRYIMLSAEFPVYDVVFQ